MNSINIIGRLTRDSDFKNNGVAVCKFTVAVDRDFKNKDGEKEADFLNCILFNKAAESLTQYLVKGKLVGITGRLQSGNYTNKEGNKVYTYDIIVEKTKFLDTKGSNNNQNNNSVADDGFKNADITEISDDCIPF